MDGLLNSLRLKFQKLTEAQFNSVLLNLYRDQNDRMGFHSDDEVSLGPEPTIASLSYGATRTLIFKHRSTKTQSTKVRFASGSLLLMRGLTEYNWPHGIERERQPCRTRINPSVRSIRKLKKLFSSGAI